MPTIDKEQNSLRLDMYIWKEAEMLGLGKIPNRSQAQKVVNKKAVFVNGKNTTNGYKVKEGDEIKIDFDILKEKEAVVIEKEKKNKEIKMKDVLIFENDDFLIINKPAGLLVHGNDTLVEYTLVDFLLEERPKIKGVGDDEYRPGIVHRLDRDVSGLLLVVKTNESFKYFKGQFSARKMKKKYIALVYGTMPEQSARIDFPVDRSQKGYKMAALPKTNKGETNLDGKEAITYYRVEKEYVNYSLLDVEIETGRTHQIRVHLSALNHSVVGDEIYGARKMKEKNRKHKLGRIFLTAVFLAFTDVNGDKHEFKIEMPDSLKDFLTKIR